MVQFLGMLAAIGLTAACWGMYGPVLHIGREHMHSPLRPFVCVGVAYFVIAVFLLGTGYFFTYNIFLTGVGTMDQTLQSIITSFLKYKILYL